MTSDGKTRQLRWFQKPSPIQTQQLTLFSRPLPEVLADLHVSKDELKQWQDDGWISSVIVGETILEPWHDNEIRFVRDVVRSGLPRALIVRLLGELPRPMNFDPERVAYSFSLGWVEAKAPPDPSDFVDGHVEEWLGSLAESEDEDRLMGLRDLIDELLESSGEDSEEAE